MMCIFGKSQSSDRRGKAKMFKLVCHYSHGPYSVHEFDDEKTAREFYDMKARDQNCIGLFLYAEDDVCISFSFLMAES